MKTNRPELVSLPADRVREASRVLADAFYDNPSTLSLLPVAEEDRGRKLERVERGFVDATRRFGDAQVVLDGDAIVGVSLSYAPGRYPPGVSGMARIALGPVLAGVVPAWRYAQIGAYMKRVHPHEPHFYLFVIGVAPAHQGRGFGGLLLRELAARAERAGVACYLETDTESNVALYRHHGYEVVRDEQHPRAGDLRMWTMWRPRA